MLQVVLDDQWADDNWVRRVGDHSAALGKVQPGQGRVLEPKSALEETCASHGVQFIGWSGVQAKCSDKSRGQLLEAPNYTPHGKSSEQPSARPPHPSFSSYGWQGSSQSPWKTVDSYGNRGMV